MRNKNAKETFVIVSKSKFDLFAKKEKEKVFGTFPKSFGQ